MCIRDSPNTIRDSEQQEQRQEEDRLKKERKWKRKLTTDNNNNNNKKKETIICLLRTAAFDGMNGIDKRSRKPSITDDKVTNGNYSTANT